MFSKTTTKDAASAEPTAARKLAPASLITEGVRVTGNMETAGDLHLDGALEGDLRAGMLVIGETGSVDGAIHADCVEVRGRVTGVICARRVKLWATARVDGDISHTEIAIEAGAHFEGRSLALVSPEAPAVLSVAAE